MRDIHLSDPDPLSAFTASLSSDLLAALGDGPRTNDTSRISDRLLSLITDVRIYQLMQENVKSLSETDSAYARAKEVRDRYYRLVTDNAAEIMRTVFLLDTAAERAALERFRIV